VTRSASSMPVGTNAPGRASIPEKTLRTDNWRKAPTLTFVLLTAWVLYAFVRTIVQAAYFAAPEHYLTPFYSPCVTSSCAAGSHDFGTWFGDFPALIPFAIVTLPFLLGFRLTCYYYRRAYYRAFWQSPPGCAVAEPHGKYTGETRFPLILNNVHRYFFYAGLVFNVILTWDGILAFRNGAGQWGHMSVGTLVLLANATLLWLYSLSCHSCRHAIGGRLKHFSKHPVRYKGWTLVSKLNHKHMLFAWVSLFGVALADAYVALVANGTFSNPTFF
jgi:hypothetical protein